MARTALTVQTIIQAGITPSFQAVTTDGHSFINNGNTYLEIVNAHTSNTWAGTVVHPGQVDSLAVADQALSVDPSTTKKFGPFSARFNQPGTQEVYVEAVTTTGASIAAFRIG